MPKSLEIKSVNPNIKQNQVAKEISYSISTLPRYRNEITMLLPHRITLNSQKRKTKDYKYKAQ